MRRGSLVHQVLEQFFGAHLGSITSPGRLPDAAWGRSESAACTSCAARLLRLSRLKATPDAH
jgi:hypothetical protein